MSNLKTLREQYEKAEARAQKIMAEKDDALQKVRDTYGDKLREANDKAAHAQKTWMDAEAAAELASREDREEAQRIADQLGLTLPDA